MKKKRSADKLSAWLKKATLVDWLIISGIGIAVVAIIVLSIVLLVKMAPSKPSSEVESVVNSTVIDNPLADSEYNKDTDAIDEKEYSETILEETKDAGKKYVDETLFIGDSNTVRMMSYGHTTLANDVAAQSMGIQHVASKGIALFVGMSDAVTVPKAVQIIQPKRIIITYGTNNTIGWTTKTFVDEYKKAINSITKVYPYAEIIINSIPPVDKIRENPNVTMQTIDAFNSALAKMAKAEGYKYLNSAEALKDEKHGFAKTDYTISDGIHLSKKGMDAFFDYVRTHAYDNEDTRPKPLKAVPKRKETPPGIITGDPIFDRTQKKGIQVMFVNETPDMGALEGKTEQTVEVGKTCDTVTAVPLEGYAVSSWSCNVGKLDSTTSLSQNFVVPQSTEKIIVSVKFEPVYITLSNTTTLINSATLDIGGVFKPVVGFAPASYSHSRDFVAASSVPTVATVAPDGTITAVGAGTSVITYSALRGKLVAQLTVTVATKNVPLTGISVTEALAVEVGKTGQISVVYLPADATSKPAATFASDNAATAAVDANGVVTGVAAGTAHITITVGTFTKTCTVTVNAAAPPTPVLPPDSTAFSITPVLTLAFDGSGTIVVTQTPADAVNKPTPTFVADGTGYITVDANGNVTAVAATTGAITAPMTATVTVTVGSLGSQTCTITINPPPPPVVP